jgi:hypothetical protein
MKFIVLAKRYSVFRFNKDSTLPDWIYSSDFYSITKTKDETSVITIQNDIDLAGIEKNDNWRIIKIVGPLDFSLIGIIAEVSGIFKESRIFIFTISTYETDYILIKQKDLNSGIEALREEGHKVTFEN